ncbi:MAG TPA: HAMP domain-containing sensor histidine kinase [Dongiaceae bacterium]
MTESATDRADTSDAAASANTLLRSRHAEAGRLARVVKWLACAMAAIVAVLVPASYFIVGYSYEARHLATEANLQSVNLPRAGSAAIEAWREDPAILQDLLPLDAGAHKDVLYRVIGEDGGIVATLGFPQDEPALTRGALLMFEDGTVALLEVQRSLRPLLYRTAIAATIGVVLAGALLTIFWILPARIIRRIFIRLARSETDLVLAREHAEAASHAKSEFLAVMSHELRTPLNAIIGFAELMQRTTFGPLGHKRYDEYVNDIHSSGRHLLEMVNDILDLTKAEAGKLELIEEVVDMAEVAEAACRMVAPQTRADSITINNWLTRNLPRLRGDERRLTQIVLNFLSNAVKFSPPGGRIDIDGFVNEEGDLLISVRDTGIGIAEPDIPRVLEIFQQADKGHARRYGGTGLGLPLAKRLIELHGGNLVLESKLGAGTRVIARFPAKLIVPRTDAAQIAPVVRLARAG